MNISNPIVTETLVAISGKIHTTMMLFYGIFMCCLVHHRNSSAPLEPWRRIRGDGPVGGEYSALVTAVHKRDMEFIQTMIDSAAWDTLNYFVDFSLDDPSYGIFRRHKLVHAKKTTALDIIFERDDEEIWSLLSETILCGSSTLAVHALRHGARKCFRNIVNKCRCNDEVNTLDAFQFASVSPLAASLHPAGQLHPSDLLHMVLDHACNIHGVTSECLRESALHLCAYIETHYGTNSELNTSDAELNEEDIKLNKDNTKHNKKDTVAGDLIKCSVVCECLCVWNVHCE